MATVSTERALSDRFLISELLNSGSADASGSASDSGGEGVATETADEPSRGTAPESHADVPARKRWFDLLPESTERGVFLRVGVTAESATQYRQSMNDTMTHLTSLWGDTDHPGFRQARLQTSAELTKLGERAARMVRMDMPVDRGLFWTTMKDMAEAFEELGPEWSEQALQDMDAWRQSIAPTIHRLVEKRHLPCTVHATFRPFQAAMVGGRLLQANSGCGEDWWAFLCFDDPSVSGATRSLEREVVVKNTICIKTVLPPLEQVKETCLKLMQDWKNEGSSDESALAQTREEHDEGTPASSAGVQRGEGEGGTAAEPASAISLAVHPLNCLVHVVNAHYRHQCRSRVNEARMEWARDRVHRNDPAWEHPDVLRARDAQSVLDTIQKLCPALQNCRLEALPFTRDDDAIHAVQNVVFDDDGL